MNTPARSTRQPLSSTLARTGKPPMSAQRTVLERLNEVATTAPTATQPVQSSPVEQPDPFNGKSFRLDVLNAAEDIPRLVRGFVKIRDFECALVLRPLDQQGLLVHAQEGQAWKWVGLESDIPARPMTDLPPREALALLKGAQTQVPAQGPVTLRGQWSGKLSCERGQPRVSLQRKVASYGVLHIWSDADKSLWFWRVERAQKWFTRAGQSAGEAHSLMVAIQQGLASAMGLLGEACSIRDSRRRAALDAQYAEVHPVKPAREGKDPTEKFKVKESKETNVSAPKRSTQKERKNTPEAPIQSTQKTTQETAQETTPAPKPSGKAAETPAQAGAPRKTRTPKTTRTQAPAPAQAPHSAEVSDIDPAKDKLLLDAFGDAISKALAQLG